MAIALSSSFPVFGQVSKSILARLLATENITIMHEDVETASFDLKSRVLRLPKWANASRELYDMLVGHEVSHALHTPMDEWIAGMNRIAAATGYSEILSKTYMNIVEDARIERLIKVKFPGLKRDFFIGYEALLEKKIFGDISNPSAMCLGDRLNLHFKVGIHSGMKIPFTMNELQFIKAMDETKTFEEVIDLTIEILLSLSKNSNHPEPQNGEGGVKIIDTDGEGEGEDSQSTRQVDIDGEGEGEGEGEGKEGKDDSKEGEGKGKGEGKDDSKEGKEGKEGSQGNSDKGSVGKNRNGLKEEIPQTNEKMEKGIQEKISKPQDGSAVCPPVVRVKVPPAHNCVISYKTILKDVRADLASMKCPKSVEIALAPIQVSAYRDASKAMASAFNRKKSADIFKRSNIAKTGNLDTLRMNQYRWTDDVFRRVTKVSEGKNHGICILLDWSGSMSSIMQSTIGQLIILTDFCRLVGIPFEVYAFTDFMYYHKTFSEDGSEVNAAKRNQAQSDFNSTYRNDDVRISPINLLNFLSSAMNKVDYELAKSLLYNIRAVRDQLPNGSNFSYSGTPTVSALYEMSHLIREFRVKTNVQICHTVILTDGEAGDAARLNMSSPAMSVALGSPLNSRYGTAGVMDDAITGMSYDIQRISKIIRFGQRTSSGPLEWNFGSVALPSEQETANIDVWIACDIIRRRTQSQIHWIALHSGGSIIQNHRYRLVPNPHSHWKRDGFICGTSAGFDSVTVVNPDKFSASNAIFAPYTPQNPIASGRAAMSKTQLQKSFVDSQCGAGGLKMVASIIGDRIGTS